QIPWGPDAARQSRGDCGAFILTLRITSLPADSTFLAARGNSLFPRRGLRPLSTFARNPARAVIMTKPPANPAASRPSLGYLRGGVLLLERNPVDPCGGQRRDRASSSS